MRIELYAIRIISDIVCQQDTLINYHNAFILSLVAFY